jgi:hypothetical protein
MRFPAPHPTRTTAPSRTGRRAVIAIAGLAVIAAGVVGVWGLVSGPRTPTPAPPTTTPTAPPTDTHTTSPAGSPPTSPDTNPGAETGSGIEAGEQFARQVASLIFDWDTTTLTRAAVVERVIAVGDPAGEETAGLAADLDAYVPDLATWADLTAMTTRQRAEVLDVTVPAGWVLAETQAAPGQLRPGAIAYTIGATRHREGTWRDQPTTYSGPLAFTIFAACPTGGPCYLLRLSQPGNPLT